MPDQPQDEQAYRSLCEVLASATPSDRARLVLGQIEEHADGRLVLPARAGIIPTLDGIDLSREAIEPRSSPIEAPWWDAELARASLRTAELRGTSLRGADLRGVDLEGADLQDADLEGADLRGASLRKVDLRRCRLARADLRGADLRGVVLREAHLEHADLSGTDLAGVDLQGALLGEADLRGAMLEEADLQDGSLRFAKLRGTVLEKADLRRTDLWGADLQEADLRGADLREARLEEVLLGGAILRGADLQSAVIRQATARDADLRGADLRGTILAGTDLRGAVLREARLQEVALSSCDITHVHLGGAKLDDTQLQVRQLGGAIGEEVAGEFEAAAEGYLALERNFLGLGDPDAATWAYRRRRRMQKRDALARAHAALEGRRGRVALAHYSKYAADQLAEWVCDYGESVPRVLGSLLVVYVAFTLLYGVTGSVVREVPTPDGVVLTPTRDPVDVAIFGLVAMATGSPELGLLPRDRFALLLTGLHVFLGIALTGLLGFVLGNRIRR